MLTSSACCSRMRAMFNCRRKTRLPAALTSTTGPSPLAVTVVASGTRNVSTMAGIVAKLSASALPRFFVEVRGRARKSLGLYRRLGHGLGIERVNLLAIALFDLAAA